MPLESSCAFLLLALVVGAVGCGVDSEALSPEAKEIRDFLNDKHVNAVLWEEWNIFDEWSYYASLYDKNYSTKEYIPFQDWEKYRNQEHALHSRAVENHRNFIGIKPPPSLANFWNDITEAIHWFWSWVTASPTPAARWGLDKSYGMHQEAWLELKRICGEQHIELEWPLPRILTYSPDMPPIPSGGPTMPPIPTRGIDMPPIPVS